MRLIALIFLLIAPSLGIGKVWDKDARLSNLGSINISFRDATDGGCWTNISEVRRIWWVNWKSQACNFWGPK